MALIEKLKDELRAKVEKITADVQKAGENYPIVHEAGLDTAISKLAVVVDDLIKNL